MGGDFFEVSVNLIKLLIIFFSMVSAVPMLVWLERRGSAFIQHRLGPNRVGPAGLLQLAADAVKFLYKQEFVPAAARETLYYLAPIIAMIPAALAFAAIPLSSAIKIDAFEFLGKSWGPYLFPIQGYEVGVGLIFVVAISSLATYGVLIAGWSSGNKYSLLGALRASAQMLSYELGLSLTITAALLIYGTFDFNIIIDSQSGPLQFGFMSRTYSLSFLPNWGIFYQPLGFLLFFVAIFAESNRLPFDLAESESELVAGFHTEYGGFKMLMFFIGEYGHMMVGSALAVTLYFGGFGLPIPGLTAEVVNQELFNMCGCSFLSSIVTSVIFLGAFLVKLGIFLWIFIWVRWTLPRFRYDQLMNFGWKTLLPWALGNTVLTAGMIFLSVN